MFALRNTGHVDHVKPEKHVGASNHSKNIMMTSRLLELLYMYLFIPFAYISINRSKYGNVIVDDYTCFIWVVFLQDKGETQGTLKRFLKRAQNYFDLRIKKIRRDNCTEFKNIQVDEFLEEEGMKHEFSSPYSPQQNLQGVCLRSTHQTCRAIIGEQLCLSNQALITYKIWSKMSSKLCCQSHFEVELV
jgi:hypothetical protein